MIDPKEFLSRNSSTSTDELEEIEGTFSCPENGCYKVTSHGLINPNTRVITWTCSEGHVGKAKI